jgi:hypothetical protein
VRGEGWREKREKNQKNREKKGRPRPPKRVVEHLTEHKGAARDVHDVHSCGGSSTERAGGQYRARGGGSTERAGGSSTERAGGLWRRRVGFRRGVPDPGGKGRDIFNIKSPFGFHPGGQAPNRRLFLGALAGPCPPPRPKRRCFGWSLTLKMWALPGQGQSEGKVQ